jgi:hypothetical protein
MISYGTFYRYITLNTGMLLQLPDTRSDPDLKSDLDSLFLYADPMTWNRTPYGSGTPTSIIILILFILLFYLCN